MIHECETGLAGAGELAVWLGSRRIMIRLLVCGTASEEDRTRGGGGYSAGD